MTIKEIEDPLIHYLLHLGDNALILGHRNSEWCGHGPVLEQDIALTNIALDQVGQARNFYQYAAILINEINGESITEDSLAYLRDSWDYKNCLLAELPNGDWGQTILKQFIASAFQYYLYQELEKNSNQQLAAIASKSLKELTYHLRWSTDWVLRLGDGTAESKKKMQEAIQAVWPYTNEWVDFAEYELEFLNGNHNEIKNNWKEKILKVFAEAGLKEPSEIWMQKGGKQGTHTEHLGYILTEMQFLQRAYPGADW
jgi:ring-1,2-phenylacetyl-CoA epoxidase subunit PaaC